MPSDDDRAGAGVWLWARAHGQKRALSIGCMPGHGEQPASSAPQQLEGELAELKQQVRALQAQLEAGSRAGVTNAGELATVGRE